MSVLGMMMLYQATVQPDEIIRKLDLVPPFSECKTSYQDCDSLIDATNSFILLGNESAKSKFIELLTDQPELLPQNMGFTSGVLVGYPSLRWCKLALVLPLLFNEAPAVWATFPLGSPPAVFENGVIVRISSIFNLDYSPKRFIKDIEKIDWQKMRKKVLIRGNHISRLQVQRIVDKYYPPEDFPNTKEDYSQFYIQNSVN